MTLWIVRMLDTETGEVREMKLNLEELITEVLYDYRLRDENISYQIVNKEEVYSVNELQDECERLEEENDDLRSKLSDVNSMIRDIQDYANDIEDLTDEY